jgi:hypothetical protein
MSPAEINRIRVRSFKGVERVGIRPKRRGLRDRPRTAGFDIETCDGMPYILGCEGGNDDVKDVIEIQAGQGLPQLLRWAKQLCSREKTLVMGAHNIRFDLGVLFYDWCTANGYEFPATADDLRAFIEEGRFQLWIGPVTFATFKWGHRTIHFIDTFAYFKTSLVNAVKQLGLGETKADFEGRGEPEWYMKRFPLAEIGPYCLQDAHMAKLLTDQIVTWWMDFGIRPAISGPQMAGRVFCKKFVKAAWQPTPEMIRVISMLAYHGGRNIFIGKPGWYEHLRAYDVNSAYTWAMTQMPDMTEGEWRIGEIPPEPKMWGLCVISGELPTLRYPVVYTSDFKSINGDVVENLAITSMEYDLLRELAPKWEPREVTTFQWKSVNEGPSDLAHYAKDNWDRRVASQTIVEKTLYKFLSNSLYGKFIARSPEMVENGEEFKIAGELFYPPIAAWITALVRCLIIRTEFQYDVIHTATDGVMTTQTMPSSNELGRLKLENEGPALILRNKLYLHWGMDGKLKKLATHGFQGDRSTLLTLLREGRTTYLRKRLRGWKEAKRDRERPFAPISMDMALSIPDGPWKEIVAMAKRDPYRKLLQDS